MSRDNWEKLVSAVVKKQQLWDLFHEQSSISSSSSASSFSFRLSSSSLEEEDSAKESLLKNDLVEELFPDVQVKKKYSKSPRRRDLVIQVPDISFQLHNAFRLTPDSFKCSSNRTPSTVNHVPSSRIRNGPGTPSNQRGGNWPDDEKHESHPLPLPPKRTNSSAANSPSSVLRGPGRPGNLASPGSPWKRGKLLTADAFGYVYVCFNCETGEMCAMKEVMLFSDDAKSKKYVKKWEQEITVLSSLSHPNIVQYYGSETVDEKLYVCFEYVSGGTVYKILNEFGRLGESAIRSYTKQILLGLAYLHSKNTVHRDIKGASILLDPKGSVKLANFGIAKHITAQFDPLTFEGSPYWMAPEVVTKPDGCSLAVDIWSLGCTVIEMATSKPPWSPYDPGVALFKIGNSKELPTIPDHLSEEGKQFVRLCLQRNPLTRPTAAQLLKHSFVKSNIHSSDIYSPRNIGVGVFPVPVPALNRKMSPPPLASYHTRSGASPDAVPPLNGKMSPPTVASSQTRSRPSPVVVLNGKMPPTLVSSFQTRSRPSQAQTGVILSHRHINQSKISLENFHKMPKLIPSLCSNSLTYWDPDILRGLHSGYHASIHEHTSSDNERQIIIPNARRSVLADRLSLKRDMKISPG